LLLFRKRDDQLGSSLSHPATNAQSTLALCLKKIF